jgi:hypothetical protein
MTEESSLHNLTSRVMPYIKPAIVGDSGPSIDLGFEDSPGSRTALEVRPDAGSARNPSAGWLVHPLLPTRTRRRTAFRFHIAGGLPPDPQDFLRHLLRCPTCEFIK